jgi:hypothetical protein
MSANCSARAHGDPACRDRKATQGTLLRSLFGIAAERLPGNVPGATARRDLDARLQPRAKLIRRISIGLGRDPETLPLALEPLVALGCFEAEHGKAIPVIAQLVAHLLPIYPQ